MSTNFYIDAILSDGTSINNIDFFKDYVGVENSEGDILNFTYDEILDIRFFYRIEIESINDFLTYSKNKKVYVITSFDCEPDAIFNNFSDYSFSEYLKENDIETDRFEDVCNSAWGLLKGKEKEVTFKQLKKIIEDNE